MNIELDALIDSKLEHIALENSEDFRFIYNKTKQAWRQDARPKGAGGSNPTGDDEYEITRPPPPEYGGFLIWNAESHQWGFDYPAAVHAAMKIIKPLRADAVSTLPRVDPVLQRIIEAQTRRGHATKLPAGNRFLFATTSAHYVLINNSATRPQNDADVKTLDWMFVGGEHHEDDSQAESWHKTDIARINGNDLQRLQDEALRKIGEAEAVVSDKIVDAKSWKAIAEALRHYYTDLRYITLSVNELDAADDALVDSTPVNLEGESGVDEGGDEIDEDLNTEPATKSDRAEKKERSVGQRARAALEAAANAVKGEGGKKSLEESLDD